MIFAVKTRRSSRGELVSGTVQLAGGGGQVPARGHGALTRR